MHKHTLVITAALVLLATLPNAGAQQVLSLEQCRQRAMNGSSHLRQAEAKQQQTTALQHAALWQMLPKLSANGGYVWMQKSVNLLSESQKDRLSHIGNEVQTDLSDAIHQQLADIPYGSTIADRLDAAYANSNVTATLNDEGASLVQSLETDTRRMGLITATVTQPIYTGGKLLAAYRSARLLNELSGVELDAERESTLISVDEAYYQVVSVQHKQQLAQQYANLLDTLLHNVELAVEADMATAADLAQVRVKHNEAQMNLIKATNGLSLAKMLLAQRCGMPLDTTFAVDTACPIPPAPAALGASQLQQALANRSEMHKLRIADSLALQGVRVAASGLQPNIVATAGYMASNPNVFDGFSNTWGGSWMAGVAVNIPIAHPGAIYAVKAAKAKRRQTALQAQEAAQLIELQISKVSHELELAYSKLEQSRSALQAARENLRLATESHQAGMCSSSDLMAAQTAWMQAQGEVIDSRIEITLGHLYLRQALGQ